MLRFASGLLWAIALAAAADGGACGPDHSRVSYLYEHRMTGPLGWRGAPPTDPSEQPVTVLDDRFSGRSSDDWYLEGVYGFGVWSYFGGALYRLMGVFPRKLKDAASTGDARLNFIATVGAFNAAHVTFDAAEYRAFVLEDWTASIRAQFPGDEGERHAATLRRGYDSPSLFLTQPALCAAYPWIRIGADRHGFALQGTDLFGKPYDPPHFDRDQYADNVGACRYLLRVCERNRP